MMLHAIYGIFDEDIYRVDLRVKAKIEVIAVKANENTPLSLGKIDIPIGKASVFELQKGKTFSGIKSGYMPLPPVGPVIPTNAAATLVESNDFGDVVGKAAGIIGDHKDEFKDWLTGPKK